jgi:hypothetical protein
MLDFRSQIWRKISINDAIERIENLSSLSSPLASPFLGIRVTIGRFKVTIDWFRVTIDWFKVTIDWFRVTIDWLVSMAR